METLPVMKNLAPDIFRKRLLAEGYFTIDVNEQTLVDFFQHLTSQLSLKTYGAPIVHTTGGAGKAENQGYDAFVPLIDSGIYIAVWQQQSFMSMIIYTCKDFPEDQALTVTKSYFGISEIASSLF
jgi:S-adenosylmethionine decarboxylase